jgi:hypothetical protein
MDDDFKDVLSIFSDDPEKKESPPADADEVAEVAKPGGVSASAAPSTGTFKKLAPPGKGLPRPTPGGKFARPSAPGAPIAPGATAASKEPTPVLPSPSVPIAVAAPVLTTPPKAANSLHNVLLFLLLLLTLISIIISAGALTKIGAMRTEMKLLNENMKAVRTAADRSWQIKCGIFSPVPNQRPQEYMIMYEEKNGKLVRKETIIKPAE